MPDQVQSVGSGQAIFLYLFSWLGAVSMFLLITVASCTSSHTFNEIYSLVAELLSLSRTGISAALRASPNLGHLLCYAFLSFFLSGVYARRNKYYAPVVAGLFGVMMEVVQLFIPSREPGLLDIGFNILGIAIGFGVYWIWQSHVRGEQSPHSD